MDTLLPRLLPSAVQKSGRIDFNHPAVQVLFS